MFQCRILRSSMIGTLDCVGVSTLSHRKIATTSNPSLHLEKCDIDAIHIKTNTIIIPDWSSTSDLVIL